MADDRKIVSIVICLFGIYFLVRPMSTKVVSGKEWKENPEAAEKKQKWRSYLYGVFFILLGIVFFIFA